MLSKRYMELSQHVDYTIGEEIISFVQIPPDEDDNPASFILTAQDLGYNRYGVFLATRVGDEIYLSRDRHFTDWNAALEHLHMAVRQELGRRVLSQYRPVAAA